MLGKTASFFLYEGLYSSCNFCFWLCHYWIHKQNWKSVNSFVFNIHIFLFLGPCFLFIFLIYVPPNYLSYKLSSIIHRQSHSKSGHVYKMQLFWSCSLRIWSKVNLNLSLSLFICQTDLLIAMASDWSSIT